MTVFTFDNTILLMSVRARNMVRDAYFLKERIELLVFITPICLDRKNFTIKLAFNHSLKAMKAIKNFRFVFNKIDPHEFTEIIDK